MPSPVQKAVSGRLGTWRGCAVLVATTALALAPIGASRANWLSDALASSPKHDEASSKHQKAPAHAASKHAAATKHATSPKPHHVKVAALGPTSLPASALRPGALVCKPAKFRIVVDVGHTAESEGATSARNVPEFSFNLRLAQQIVEKLKATGFAGTKLLVTEGKAKPSLFKRVAEANDLNADLFLSIHHDSVPNKFLEDWEYEGQKSHYSDRFGGYSVFVSHINPEFTTSLVFAELVAKEMKAKGLQYARQYTMAIMGHYQHPLLDKDAGVYAYDQLVVLRKTNMPAVLLEAGSIINRDEELKMDSPERRDMVSDAVVSAVKNFCGPQATSSAGPDIAAGP
ncbi:N-acetylmuramoyl-L-alanine amidase [Bradyrhizobium sp.]|uniref:N-acetylmuramoyl-L-alanine amidase family protein n=1 Tax=Bradyrhizobium sp. TaxID=376 RepID=UPI0026314A1A|nr:N-acetylmuramoyl-L-alanine amidase [Bradyrhizobium sp.]